MEKKYRLKEEVTKYVGLPHDQVNTIDKWIDIGFSIEALEEVPQRIKLRYNLLGNNYKSLLKLDGSMFKDQEKDLCELVLQVAQNKGELVTYNAIKSWVNGGFP